MKLIEFLETITKGEFYLKIAGVYSEWLCDSDALIQILKDKCIMDGHADKKVLSIEIIKGEFFPGLHIRIEE